MVSAAFPIAREKGLTFWPFRRVPVSVNADDISYQYGLFVVEIKLGQEVSIVNLSNPIL